MGLTITATGSTIELVISNYKPFFKLLIWFWVQTLILIVILVTQLAYDEWSKYIKKRYSYKAYAIMLSFNILIILINVFELVVAGKLLIFHIYIKIKGISTFEYIKSKDKGYKSRFKIKRSSIERNNNSIISKSNRSLRE